VIVRIATDGQYHLPDGDVGRLNDLDDRAQQAIEAGDEQGFRQLLAQMVELVRTGGRPAGDDELVESGIIIPPPDSSIAEVGALFDGEGLIPD
jgi:PspAA-like protein